MLKLFKYCLVLTLLAEIPAHAKCSNGINPDSFRRIYIFNTKDINVHKRESHVALSGQRHFKFKKPHKKSENHMGYKNCKLGTDVQKLSDLNGDCELLLHRAGDEISCICSNKGCQDQKQEQVCKASK